MTASGKCKRGLLQNIKRQQAPDGTTFKPRKAQPIRSKKGRVKHEMFAKLRTAKYLKVHATSNEAVIEFTGRVQRMARVHHYGLHDRPSHKGRIVRYEARPLLGVSSYELDVIEEIILDHLSTP
ncbi:phage virion morphogenesis protein [Pantoea allii]|uniref:phage virion morphogenesis protein n=1 Tax=Pantoea allii TaxID=574096 RepID=UPI0024B7768A|nr:phage virion morphogenesis protein [Pantoea allii]MDJ0036449.1 phage virion morphogenesis protein [Pantoea allii]